MNEEVKMLKEIIELNTTNPPGNENLVCDFIEQKAKNSNLFLNRTSIQENRSNLS